MNKDARTVIPRILAAVTLVLPVLAAFAAAPPARRAPELPLGVLARNVGPATMGGRITALAVVESKPAIQYVGAASGGVWKTTDDGLSWACVFDGRPLAAVGALAVAPSDPDVVYAGMGEANARNSVSWGNGVFVTRDGGKTWKHVGLEATHHIGKIVVHPKDPDVAYVAALGRAWAANKERGVFMTKDGGKTWKHVLALDEDTGAIDLAMEPGDPETLYATAYAVRRDGFSGGNPVKQFSNKAGLYRSRDGGKTWTRLTKGLPDRPIGRCGIDVYRKDPKVLYAVLQTDKTDISTVPGQKMTDQKKGVGPVESGGIFRSKDRGDTWVKVNDLCPRPFYFSQIRIDPADDNRIWVLGIPLFASGDGGKTFRSNAGGNTHPDHHDLWIDPADSRHLILGNDGGLYYSRDRSQSWTPVKNLPISQFYAIGLDMQDPYRIYGGLQDNGSWGGPSRTDNPIGILNSDWSRVLGMDGFYCQVPPDDPNLVYAEGQYGRLYRVELRAKRSTLITPKAQNKEEKLRFNWSSPLVLSAHDSRTLYFGGNLLFKSTDRGLNWRRVSDDLTRGKAGVAYKSTGHTLTTIGESPLKQGVLYVGSDDGRIHVTQDDGKTWTELSVPKLSVERWISRLECSPHAVGTVFLAIDRHRNDDRAPYLYRSDDYGKTWTSIASDLPAGGPVYVVRQDPRNKDLLYAGTELGLYVSFDAGGSWQRLKQGLPNVPVHDVVVHPKAREVVVATHGRGIYVLDAVPLQEMTARVRAQKAHLFPVRDTARKHRQAVAPPARTYVGSNPPDGMVIHYYLREKGDVTLEVADGQGKRVAEVEAAGEAGVGRAVWDLRRPTDRGPVAVAAGEYVIRLTHDGKAREQKVRVTGP